MTEHDIQNSIRVELSKRGWCVFRANVGKVKMADGRWFDTGLPAGFTDLFAVKDGRVVFMEVKSETGKVRDDQRLFMRTMEKIYHCPVGVVRSVEDAVKLCEEAGVIHAHWEKVREGLVVCSHCGFEPPDDGGSCEVLDTNTWMASYMDMCPECGALMGREVSRDGSI